MEFDSILHRTSKSTRRKPDCNTREMIVQDNIIKFAPIFKGKLMSRRVGRCTKNSHMFHQPKRSMLEPQLQGTFTVRLY